jgi:predicted AAA+ superfamily ATPase
MQKPGRFVLTGSSNFGLMESISQSLAGRVGVLELLPFSLGELQKAGRAPEDVDGLLFKGLFPELHDRKLRTPRWHNAYISTYVERDARQLINLKDLTLFQRFLGLCAANVGQLLNTVRLGADCGVHHATVRSWLSILETSYILFRLHPHHRNFRKRLVKTPKLYFFDTGTAARLLGIESEAQLGTHPLRGALFENWAVVELLKARLNRGASRNLYFWRNHRGVEIDVVLDHGTTLLPVEVKSGATVASDWLGNLEEWTRLAGKAAEPAWLLYGGDKRQQRKLGTVLPWHQIGRLCKKA